MIISVLSRYLLQILLLIHLAYSIFKYLTQRTHQQSNKVVFFIVFIFCFNPYVLDLVTRHTLDSLQQILWAIFILQDNSDSRSTLYYYAFLGAAVAFNPSNSIYFIINIINKKNSKGLKGFISGLGIAAGLLWLYLDQKLNAKYYKQLYFPQIFEPQFNLLWMLYAHMFNRFLTLYQIVFLIIQLSSIYLVVSLKMSHEFKVVLLTYFKLYCNFKCSQLCLVMGLFVCAIFTNKQINESIRRWQIQDRQTQTVKIKTLSLIIVIANIAFLSLDKILLNKYLNDFTLNIGYLFLFFGFPWILNSIYLAQISLNLDDLNKEEQLVKDNMSPLEMVS